MTFEPSFMQHEQIVIILFALLCVIGSTQVPFFFRPITSWHLQDKWAALHYAACNGHLALTGLLIDHGANVNATEQVRACKQHSCPMSTCLLCQGKTVTL